jgi:methylated-DNA-[protein]-cysteine S-methyltransferase
MTEDDMTDETDVLAPLLRRRDGHDAVPARLLERLAAAADGAGVLDVGYTTVGTPVGTVLLAATDQGLVRVAFIGDGEDAALAELAARISPRVLAAPSRLAKVRHQLEQYFAGERRTFDVPLDLRLAAGFRRDVLSALAAVDYGATASYSAVARAAGRPTAVRAVGTACARNPLPLVIPCHRVVRSDGAIGQYVGGQQAKRRLLDLEAAA